MNSIAPLPFMLLIPVGIAITYMAVRKRWLPVGVALAVGGAANALFFMLVSLAQGNGFLQALMVGLILGIMFTALPVASAFYFRRNEEAKKPHSQA
jgi:hypothetical protein